MKRLSETETEERRGWGGGENLKVRPAFRNINEEQVRVEGQKGTKTQGWWQDAGRR